MYFIINVLLNINQNTGILTKKTTFEEISYNKMDTD